MDQYYPALSMQRLSGVVCYARPNQTLPDQVTLESPAIFSMTDLRVVPAQIVEPNVSIEWALTRMIDRGVRMLFVVNAEDEIMGMLTSYDIQGEKPLQLQHELGLKYADILVRDVMVPTEALDVIPMAAVLHANVGHVVATLRRCGRHHALVSDRDPGGRQAIRGIFSSSQISAQLGWQIQPTHQAASFAELQSALNH